MRKIPISGGPHTGKSTMMEALAERYPEAHFIGEPAERIIKRELALQETDPDYTPLVPWIDVEAFDEAVAQEYLVTENAIPNDKELSFQDRSLWDSTYYLSIGGSKDLLAQVLRQARLANYAFAIICEPVGVYRQTNVRTETPEDAYAKHVGVKRAYEHSGLQLVSLPNVPTEERIVIVENALHELY